MPTGQTGIAIAGWGIAVDEVVSDFVAGACERLVLEGASGPGRARCSGSRARARSATPPTRGSRWACCTGRRRTCMVLVHEPGRTLTWTMPGGPPVAPLPQLIDDYQRMAGYVRPAPVVASR